MSAQASLAVAIRRTVAYKNAKVLMTPSRLGLKLVPAPARGRYDRRRSARERDRDQLERLLAATALEIAARGPARSTVGGVIRRARTGRNSFYRHFAGLTQACAAARQHARQLLESQLRHAEREARTPLERLRALGPAWLGIVTAYPAQARLLLDSPADRVGPNMNRVANLLAVYLAPPLAAARQIGAAATAADPLRLEAVAGAWEAVGRACLERRVDPASGQGLLVDLTVRAVR